MTTRDDAGTVVINGLRYLSTEGGVVQRSQLGAFIRKFTEGDAQYDSDDYLSARIYSNLSGGIGIEDGDEGATTDRFWWGTMDTTSSRMIGLPPLVTATQPSGVTGTTVRPLGVIGTQFYACFNANAYGWKDSTSDWHSTANNLDYVPVNKPIAFGLDGSSRVKVWMPQGANGVRSLVESNASNGTLTEADITANPKAVALAIWDNTLYALTTDGYLYKMPAASAAAGTWTQVTDSASTNLLLNAGETPKNLVTYFNRNGEPTLWAITDRAAYMYYEAKVAWVTSNIQFPPHPDFGRSACVWRTGEDLWITAGMDLVRQTTGNAIVPLASGLSRDQGVPQEVRGSIRDIQPEISKLYALAGNASTPTVAFTYSAQVGSSGSGNGQFNGGTDGISVNSAGALWVGDAGNNRIQKFTSGLVYSAQSGSSGTGNGQFGTSDQLAMAHDSADNLWVADKANNRIQKFNSSGTYQSKFGSAGSGNGQFSSPTGIAIKSSSGRIYVADSSNSRVQYFTSSGTYEGQWGSSGTGDGQFASTRGIAVNQNNGEVYVVDIGNARIQQFTATGTFIRAWGASGTSDGRFTNAAGIAIHPNNQHVFVCDYTRNDIQEFTRTGTFVRKFGSSGSGNGQFNQPLALAFNAAGTTLYVTDNANFRVQAITYSESAGLAAYPTLHAWPGTGWHGLWQGTSNTAVPTWMMVSAPTTHYRLWWGMDDGYAYYATLYRGFENPNQARLAGTATFGTSGYLLTSKFDAGMLGFKKLAQRVDVLPIADSISSSETMTLEFSIDDGGWETLGTVSSTTLGSSSKVSFSFGTAGRRFETIRFRLSGARGSTTNLSPFIRAFTLLFMKIPQPARSFVVVLQFPKGEKAIFGDGRTGQVMAGEIDDLADAGTFFTFAYNGQTFTNCAFAGATGHDMLVDLGGQRTLNVVQLPTTGV